MRKVSLSNRLKQLRGAVTQAKTAELLGVPQQTYSGWETEKGSPSPTGIAVICRHYGISADWFLGLSTGETPAHPVPAAAFTPPVTGDATEWRNLAISQQETIANLTRLLAETKRPTAAPVKAGGRTATATA